MFRRILILSSICIFNGSSRIDNQEKAFSGLATDNTRLIKLIYVKGEKPIKIDRYNENVEVLLMRLKDEKISVM